MTVGKVTEITARSPESFDHAMEQGISRAEDTLKNVKSAWVKDQKITCDEHGIDEYHVDLKVTFILDE